MSSTHSIPLQETPSTRHMVAIGKFGLVRAHESEPFDGITSVSRANQAAAFERMSRSKQCLWSEMGHLRPIPLIRPTHGRSAALPRPDPKLTPYRLA